MYIDTHCHFNHEQFAQDLPACLERAQAAGVEQMIVIGYDLPSSQQAVALAEAHAPALFAAIGIHPHDAKSWDSEAEGELRALALHPRVVALGEIGLDFHYDFSPRPAQFAAFRAQRDLAREIDLPVIIHCREAYPETLSVLAETGIRAVGGVMHCWAGKVAEAQQAVALGLSLGFGGTLTFKNAEEVRAAVRAVPLETLLLETDAPYLAPAPHRGQRNEPSYLPLIAAKMAELLGLSTAEIAALTTENAQRLFTLE